MTVALPTFNRPEFLAHAIESVLAQTFPSFKLVVADNATAGEAIVGRYAADRRVTYLRRPENIGMAANVWTVFAAADTEFVACLNDDDAWEPELLDTLVAALDAYPDVSVAFCDHWIMDDAGVVDRAATDAFSHRFHRDVLRRGVHRNAMTIAVRWQAIAPGQAAVFRRSSIDWTREPGGIGTFFDVWLSFCAARAGAVYYEPRRLGRFRIHAASETSELTRGSEHPLRALRQAEALLRRMLDDPALGDEMQFVRERYRRVLLRAALNLIAEGDRAEARRMLDGGARHLTLALRAGSRGAAALPASVVRAVLAARGRVRGRRVSWSLED